MPEASPSAVGTTAAKTADTTDRGTPSVCLCVPTFRRPDGLRKLLAHVAQLDYRGSISVVVVDNDAEYRAAATVVDELAPAFPFPLACVVEPQRGHTFASNRSFVAGCRVDPVPTYIAVLDDDQYPDPNWLTEMISTALRFDADLVGGPTLPVFEAPDHWVARTGLYGPIRCATGRVPMIWASGNMLIRRSVLEQYLDEPFLNDFAFTGGGDIEFFWRCRRDGRSFAWAGEARAFETIPQWRTTVGWLLRRRFGYGVTATRVERIYVKTPSGTVRRWCKGLGLLGFGVLSLPIAAFGGRHAIMHSLIQAVRGTGRIAAEFGILYEEYRNPR